MIERLRLLILLIFGHKLKDHENGFGFSGLVHLSAFVVLRWFWWFGHITWSKKTVAFSFSRFLAAGPSSWIGLPSELETFLQLDS